MENNQILVDRYPQCTKTGKKATSFDYGEYEITVRLKC